MFIDIYETENGSDDSDRTDSNLVNSVQKSLRSISTTHIHNLYSVKVGYIIGLMKSLNE